MKFEILKNAGAFAISLQLALGGRRKDSKGVSDRPQFESDPQGHPDAEVVSGGIPFRGGDSRIAELKAKYGSDGKVIPVDPTDTRFYSDEQNTPFGD